MHEIVEFLDAAKYRRYLVSRFRGDEGEDAFGFVVLMGVPKILVRDLVVDCLVAFKKEEIRWARWAREFRALPVLRGRAQIRLARKAAAMENSVLSLAAKRELKTAEWASRLRREAKLQSDRKQILDRLLLSLWAIFLYLVDRSETSWADYFDICLPRILEIARIRPSPADEKKTKWTPWMLKKRMQRAGGVKAARFTAVPLLSTEPALKRFRPPPFSTRLSPEFEHVQKFIGRTIYRGLPHRSIGGIKQAYGHRPKVPSRNPA